MQSYASTLACWRCNAPLSERGVCTECQATNRPNGTLAQHAPESERRCWKCNKLLAFAYAFRGRVVIACHRCKSDNVFIGTTSDRAINLEIARIKQDAHEQAIQARPIPARRQTVEELLEVMEERWLAFSKQRARQRGEVAVGLRFNVFMRDGFRCRYCGISVDDGAMLHADHRIPRSQGGATSLDNLITACIDCNLGKSDKLIT